LPDVRIERCAPADADEWVALRKKLWPWESDADLRAESDEQLAPAESLVLIGRAGDGEMVAFAEASLRHDYVNGCSTSPVAFLEGIYVEPAWRRHGIARRLCEAIEEWASEHGCTEFASDTFTDYFDSQRMHEALGFTETDRVIYYRKELKTVAGEDSADGTVPYLSGIDHVQVAIPSGEEERAREFYSGILGFQEVPKPPDLAARGGAWFRSGNKIVVHLGIDPGFQPATKAHIAFRCADYAGLLQRLQIHGVAIVPDERLFEGRAHCYVADPFGNRIELVAE
jgi:aminoglycoside 6'-N-acetyltransferase I